MVINADGADHLWVYRDAHQVAASCGRRGGAQAKCTVHSRGLELVFSIDVPARYQALAVAGGPDLVPSGDFDADVLAARSRGARLELQAIQATDQLLAPRGD